MRSPQAELPLWDSAVDERPVVAGPHAGELRRVLIGDRFVPYVLRRGRRRTIGLTIDHRGLRVGAPNRSSLGEIESVIRKHSAWVADKLDHWRGHVAKQASGVVDGMVIPLHGKDAPVRIVSGANRFRWIEDAATGGVALHLEPREPASSAALLERALRAKALAFFGARMQAFCERFAIHPPALRLTSARTRWGSCSRASGVRINWRLVHAPVDLVDYVVAHELAHLKEMNHTPRFWAEVERLCPDWRVARDALRRFGDTLPRYA
jgi:predicted metal-dependent hydrolase